MVHADALNKGRLLHGDARGEASSISVIVREIQSTGKAPSQLEERNVKIAVQEVEAWLEHVRMVRSCLQRSFGSTL